VVQHLACPIAADASHLGAARRAEEDTVAKRLVVLVWFPLSLLWLLSAGTPGLGQARGPSYPVPAINVRDFGAVDDAQEASGCTPSTSGSPATVNCGAGNNVFTTADAGKVIEISNAGPSNSPSPPLPPHQTFMTTIMGLDSSCSGSPCNVVDVANNANHAPTGGTYITWGTDNAAAFQRAGNACPAPSSTNVTPPLTNLASIKGCVLLVPNGGPLGTGDYMFVSGVTFAGQTSFEILGMGNSSKYEQSSQAGVRLVTAMPITIITVNSTTAGTAVEGTLSNYGGFRLENITFRDTSKNGAALGGLLMSNVSEAVIAYCSFEQFSGQQVGAAPSTTALSYGMRAVAFGGGAANNNIVLLHDKGKDNSIWYDGSDGAQDGPIVLGGDVFPTNSESAAPASGPWTSTCIGVVTTGPIRMYGTHFDVGTDSSGGNNTCIGVYTLAGGIISAKFESSALGGPAAGTGIVAGVSGASSATVTIPNTTNNGFTKTGNGYVTVLVQPGTKLVAGQTVSIVYTATADAAALGGRYIVTSASSTQFTYDQPGGGYTTSNTGTATGRVTSSLDVESTFNNLYQDVSVGTGATNNKIVDYSSNNGHADVTDNGTNDIVQILDAQAGTNSTTFSGTLTVPVTTTAPSTNGAIAYNSSVPGYEVVVNSLLQTLAGVGSACASNKFETGDSPTGPTCVQPNLGNIAGGSAPSGTYDFSGSTALKVPVASGASPATDGSVAYDNSQLRYSAGSNTINVSYPKVICASAPTGDTLSATTTMETAFATTCTIPANEIINNKIIRITLGLQTVAGGTPTTVLVKGKVVSGSSVSVYFYTAPLASSDLSSTKNAVSSFTLGGTAAAGGSASVNVAGSTFVQGQFIPNATASPITVATNSTETITFTNTFGAVESGNTISLVSLLVEALN
jgi:hypothetical protein